MADHSPSPLAPIDREHLSQLARSQGWRSFLAHLLIPRLLHASRQIDSPNNPELRTQLFRGQKAVLLELMKEVYHYADLPNPFERHWEAFTAALDSYAPPKDPQEDLLVHATMGGKPLCGARSDPEMTNRAVAEQDITCPECLLLREERHVHRVQRHSTPVL